MGERFAPERKPDMQTPAKMESDTCRSYTAFYFVHVRPYVKMNMPNVSKNRICARLALTKMLFVFDGMVVRTLSSRLLGNLSTNGSSMVLSNVWFILLSRIINAEESAGKEPLDGQSI